MMSLIEEVKKQMLALITAAFAFVAAFLWRDAIQAWLAPLYQDAEGAVGQTYAAIVVTVVVVIMILIMTKLLAPKEQAEEKK